MPRINSDIKEKIQLLSKSDLEKIVLKFAGKDKRFYDYLLVNYFDKEGGEADLFEEAKADLDKLFRKRYKGFSEELQLANMLAACTKRVNEFTKVSKNRNQEADLLLHVLNVPFSLRPNLLGTCFTAYDTKVAIMLRRLINVVTTKLNPDYLIEYQETINDYLKILHRCSGFLNSVYALPKSI